MPSSYEISMVALLAAACGNPTTPAGAAPGAPPARPPAEDPVDAPLAGAAAIDATPLAADVATSAQRFLASLSPADRARVARGFDAPDRLAWHFIPRPRPGIALRELDDAQRALAFGLLASGLGRRGFVKAAGIMALEEVLRRAEGGRGTFVRDPGAYHVSVFGTPAPDATWGWRVEGHHLSINVTLVDGVRLVRAPAFFGAAPARVRDGYLDDARVLGREEDLGFRLLASLDAEQRGRAVQATDAPEDILLGPGAAFAELPGLAAARMNAAQRTILGALVDEALASLPPELAAVERARLATHGTRAIVFTWAGGAVAGTPHYYRLRGPSFVFEYDNTQQGANHVHTVWHALEEGGGDFGLDWLRAHHRAEHGGAR